jgi:hypothetical protein
MPRLATIVALHSWLFFKADVYKIKNLPMAKGFIRSKEAMLAIASFFRPSKASSQESIKCNAMVLKLSALCLRTRMIKEAHEYVPFDEKSHPPHQLTQEDLLYPCNLYYLC